MVPRQLDEFNLSKEESINNSKIPIKLSNLIRLLARKTKWTCKCRCKVPMEAKIAASVEWFPLISPRMLANPKDLVLRFKTEAVEFTAILTSHRRQREIIQYSTTILKPERESWRAVCNRVLKGTKPRFPNKGSSNNSNIDHSNSSKCRAVTA